MEKLECWRHESRKFMGLNNFDISSLDVNGNWIVGIQPLALQQGMQADNDDGAKVIVLNRWTLELEKVLNAAHTETKKTVLNNICYRSLNLQQTIHFGQSEWMKDTSPPYLLATIISCGMEIRKIW